MMLLPLWTSLCIFTCARASPEAGGALAAAVALDGETRALQHLARHAASGQLFVAGVNRLWRLDAELAELTRLETGPVQDNVTCPAAGCPVGASTELTDSVSKLLLVLEESRQLLSCDSVRQGACWLRPLEDPARAQFLPVSVAANDEHSTTVGLLGPERYHRWDGRPHVLYVAATFTGAGPYRHDVPAIATRRLDDLQYAEFSFSQQSLLRIDVKYRDHFLVQYMDGFAAGDHVYFVTVQKKSHLPGQDEVGYTSRIARVCVTDPNYNSYIEVTVQCGAYNLVRSARLTSAGSDLAAAAGVKTGDPVLVAVFSPSDGNTMVYQNKSAVCVFPLDQVDNVFDESIHMCFNGSEPYRNMDYISGLIENGMCIKSPVPLEELDFCAVGLRISGGVTLARQPAIEYNVSLTSVAGVAVHRHTVLFLGDSDGNVRKVQLTSLTSARQYGLVTVSPGQVVLPDTQLDAEQSFLYVLSTTQVSKMRVQTCEVYTDCSSCLNSGDPYCGWCSLEKRCTVKSDCSDAGASSQRWLALDTNSRCIDFQSIEPKSLPISNPATIRVRLSTLPALPFGAKYQCVFGSAAPTDALPTADGLTCTAPPPALRPAVLAGSDHVAVPLSVRSSETNKDFVSRQFSYYDCSRHATCADCAGSAWACNWCVYDNVCTHNATSCRRTVVTGENTPGESERRGVEFCPRLRPSDTPLLVADGAPTAIRLRLENAPEGSDYHCLLRLGDRTHRVPATLSGDTVTCQQKQFSYRAATSNETGRLTVVWNGDHLVDATNVTLYKCAVLGSHRGHADCSLCVTRDARYKCAWCGDRCEFAPNCAERHESCGKPTITKIWPDSGPLEGGTLLTVEGFNLGRSEAEVRDTVVLGGASCSLVQYQVSVRLVCRTAAVSRQQHASVLVGNAAGYSEAAQRFAFKEVVLTGVSPRRGPRSGGTRITLLGANLNIGSNRSVTLDGWPCLVEPGVNLTCLTPPSNGSAAVRELTLTVDGATRTLHSPFSYTADPSVLDIRPLRSFASGGRVISVHGTHLDTVQRPRLLILRDGAVVGRGDCAALDATRMQCESPRWRPRPSPGYNSSHADARAGLALPPASREVLVGFEMDHVAAVRQLARSQPELRATMTYVPDPLVLPFAGGARPFTGEPLLVRGENLNLAADASDVRVTVGGRPCNVTALALRQLVCAPPADASGPQPVLVRFGRRLEFAPGRLEYGPASGGAPAALLAGVVCGALLLAAATLAAGLLYRRRSSAASQQFKRVQQQMNNMENNVRTECKQAFAELQTDMSDLSADLEHGRVIIHEHKTYVMNVLFPGVIDHPVGKDTLPMGFTAGVKTAMTQFEQLLCNKNFLLMLVEALEAQKTFSSRDSVSVGSLLTAVLLPKMEYLTSVVASLLLRGRAGAPRTLTRRSDSSLLERLLTCWLSVCLYEELREGAPAGRLLLLVRALHRLTERGPVDALTGAARYSLAESTLLKEQVEYKSVVIHASLNSNPSTLTCAALSCDTISQVKQKIIDRIFSSSADSRKPAPQDFDLEWLNGRGGRLTLADTDLSSVTLHGWRRVNTLSHYGLEETARLALVARHSDEYTNYSEPYSNPVTHIYATPELTLPSSSAGYASGASSCGEQQPAQVYHLTRTAAATGTTKKDDQKPIPEIYLTRLISTKGTVHKYIEDLFSALLSARHLPSPVRWLFALLDAPPQPEPATPPARRSAADVAHSRAWKASVYGVRVWGALLRHPWTVYDVRRSQSFDASVAVVADTFVEALLPEGAGPHRDLSAERLLFVKDMERYRAAAAKFFSDAQLEPAVSDQELSALLQRLSGRHAGMLCTPAAARDLFTYVSRHWPAVRRAAAATDPVLLAKLESIHFAYHGQETSFSN